MPKQLERWRQGYGCDCEGKVLPNYNRTCDAVLSGIQKTAGARPDTCPWKAYSEPAVVDILRSFKWFDSGQTETWLGQDPPNHLIEGLDHYKTVVNMIDSAEIERQKKKSKKAKRG